MQFFAKINKNSQVHKNWWLRRQIGGVLHTIDFYYDTSTGEYLSKELTHLQTKIALQFKSYITLEMISPSSINDTFVQDTKPEEPEKIEPVKKITRKKMTVEQ